MAKIFDLVEAVADSKTTISDGLVLPAPAKSMLAKAIHYRSWQKDKPFVEVSCGALPETTSSKANYSVMSRALLPER